MKAVRQSALNGQGCTPNLLPRWVTVILPSPTFSLLETVSSEQNLGSWSRHTSPPSPQVAGFADWSNFPFYWLSPLNYWLLSCVLMNLSWVTLRMKADVLWGTGSEGSRAGLDPQAQLAYLNSMDLRLSARKWCQLHRVLSRSNKMTVLSPHLMNAQCSESYLPTPFMALPSSPSYAAKAAK